MTVLRGPEAVGACELLDHVGGWAVLLPEWASVRGRVQHDPWHRYTVDGHAFAAAAEVSRLLEQDERAATTAEAGDLDALYLAAVFHDIGKGSGADHSVAGELLTRRPWPAWGVDADESSRRWRCSSATTCSWSRRRPGATSTTPAWSRAYAALGSPRCCACSTC